MKEVFHEESPSKGGQLVNGALYEPLIENFLSPPVLVVLQGKR